MTAENRSFEAIVIGRTSYGESDRIVTLLSADRGVVRGIARGARASRRRFGGALELFSRVRVQLGRTGKAGYGSGLDRLDAAELLEPHLGLRSSLEALEVASLAAEAVTRSVPEGESAPLLFEKLEALLAGAAASGRDAHALHLLALWFVLQTLETAGSAPMISSCTCCGRGPDQFETAAFSSSEGGIVCEHCTPADESSVLPAAGVRVFAEIAAASDPIVLAGIRISEQGLARLLRLTLSFFEWRTAQPLRTAAPFRRG